MSEKETPRRFDVFVLSREGVSRYDDIRGGDVTEKLRHIGLEWKQSDWAYDQAVTITVLPAYNPITDGSHD